MSRNRQSLILIVCLLTALVPPSFAEPAGQAKGAGKSQAVGQSQSSGLRVGEQRAGARRQQVPGPGLYGLRQAPAGSRYAIVDAKLVRYDPKSARVLSMIRQVDKIMG